MKWQKIITITYSTSYPFLDLITEKYRPFSDRVLYNEAGSQMDPQSYVKSSFNSVCKDKKKKMASEEIAHKWKCLLRWILDKMTW